MKNLKNVLPDMLVINGMREPKDSIEYALDVLDKHKNEVVKVVRSYVNGLYKLYIQTT